MKNFGSNSNLWLPFRTKIFSWLVPCGQFSRGNHETNWISDNGNVKKWLGKFPFH